MKILALTLGIAMTPVMTLAAGEDAPDVLEVQCLHEQREAKIVIDRGEGFEIYEMSRKVYEEQCQRKN